MAEEDYKRLVTAAEAEFGQFLHTLVEETGIPDTKRPASSIARHYVPEFLRLREEVKGRFLNHFTQTQMPEVNPEISADDAMTRSYNTALKKVAADLATDDGGKLYPALEKKLTRKLSDISALMESKEMRLHSESHDIAEAIIKKGKDKGPPKSR